MANWIDYFTLTLSDSVTFQNSELKPMINMRFASVSVSDAVANESRIRVSLHGFTFVMPPDVDWIADLGEFAKAPPGVSVLLNDNIGIATDISCTCD